MSFDFRDYPDVSGQCWLCKKYDCSKPGEKWLHILGGLTDGDYHPAIGRKCLEQIYANSDLPKPEPDVREVVRPPTDEEIGAFIREWVELRRAELTPVSEVKPDAVRAHREPGDESDSRDSSRPSKRRSQAREKGTV